MQNPIRTGAELARGVDDVGAAPVIHYSLESRPALAFGARPTHGRPRRRGACSTRWLLVVALSLFVAGCSQESTTNASTDATEVERVGESAVAPNPDRSAVDDSRPVVVFLGTSLTAGYGLPETQAFPALIQQRIDHAGLHFDVINAGVSGDTSAGGLRRLDWLLRRPISVLVLELGANDMLRGQGIEALRSNLEAILEKTRNRYPQARFVIAGMRAAPNLGHDYTEAFDAVYPELARRYGAALVPFLLEDVAARRNLNQADGIHPTAEGHRLIAERVWRVLEPVLASAAAGTG